MQVASRAQPVATTGARLATTGPPSPQPEPGSPQPAYRRHTWRCYSTTSRTLFTQSCRCGDGTDPRTGRPKSVNRQNRGHAGCRRLRPPALDQRLWPFDVAYSFKRPGTLINACQPDGICSRWSRAQRSCSTGDFRQPQAPEDSGNRKRLGIGQSTDGRSMYRTKPACQGNYPRDFPRAGRLILAGGNSIHE